MSMVGGEYSSSSIIWFWARSIISFNFEPKRVECRVDFTVGVRNIKEPEEGESKEENERLRFDVGGNIRLTVWAAVCFSS